MKKLSKDFIDFFGLLEQYHVAYLVIGGYAVMFYGYPRVPDDLDIFVSPDTSNIDSLLQALSEFGFGDLGLTKQDFADPSKMISLGYPPDQVNIVTGIDGVSWEQAWAHRVQGRLEGVQITFISKDDLIKHKRIRNLPQDKMDADMLESKHGTDRTDPFTEPSIP
ncbi:MAG: hypothetical protein SNJ56_02580 [Termitinemataceae bacterium]